MDVISAILILGLGASIGFIVGFFSGEGSEAYFRYKTRIAELKADEEERMEEYIKKQRGGKE